MAVAHARQILVLVGSGAAGGPAGDRPVLQVPGHVLAAVGPCARDKFDDVVGVAVGGACMVWEAGGGTLVHIELEDLEPEACLVKLVLGDHVHSDHVEEVVARAVPSAVHPQHLAAVQQLAASADGMPRANIHQVSAVFAHLS